MQINYTGTDAEKAKADAVIKTILSMTPQEAADYVDKNVTDLQSAKDFLKKLAMLQIIIVGEIRALR